MTTPQEVQAKLIEVAAKALKKSPADITPSSRFREDLGADSLDVTVLLFEFEDAFQMTIPDQEILKMKTVEDVVQYVVKTKNS